MTGLPEILVGWAEKIDHRLGPISGRDADALAVLLRKAGAALAGIKHPTGSEQFAGRLARLSIPVPWSLCDEETGEILAANKAVACTALDAATTALDERATEAATLIICAINTLAGFRAEAPRQ
jgi:hypothetical protein